MKACLFVFEGADGVGKSTLAAALHDRLRQQGIPSELLLFPGREPGTLGGHIYRLYHEPKTFGLAKMSVKSEQLLFTAAHADVIETRILPSLRCGRHVVLDRYWWSTWVYASAGGLDEEIRDLLIDLEQAIWQDVKPTCLFLVQRGTPLKAGIEINHWNMLMSMYNRLNIREFGQTNIVEVQNDSHLSEAVQLVINSVSKWVSILTSCEALNLGG